MRLGRILRIAALAIWLTASTYYWWHFVPPAPSHIIPLKGRSHRWTPGLGDVIVLSRKGEGEMRNTGPRGERRPASFGPLQFYDPANGKLLREVLTADDEILALELKPREFAIVFRDGVVSAVDLSNPEKRNELEGIYPGEEFTFVDGPRVRVSSIGRVSTFDLVTGARAGPTASQAGASRGSIRVSEDERRYVTFENQHLVVYDSATDSEICRILLPSASRFQQVGFSPDSKDLLMLEDTGRQQRGLTIWDSTTGQLRTKQPSQSLPRGPLSRHAAWVISNENSTSFVATLVSKLPASLQSRLQRSTFFWNVMVQADVARAHLMVLTDTFTGQTLGRYQVPTTAEWLLVADDERGAVAFGDFNAIHCYRVPADRDWLWLLTWGAAPVAAAWGFLFLFRKWRRRRPPAVVAAATP